MCTRLPLKPNNFSLACVCVGCAHCLKSRTQGHLYCRRFCCQCPLRQYPSDANGFHHEFTPQSHAALSPRYLVSAMQKLLHVCSLYPAPQATIF